MGTIIILKKALRTIVILFILVGSLSITSNDLIQAEAINYTDSQTKKVLGSKLNNQVDNFLNKFAFDWYGFDFQPGSEIVNVSLYNKYFNKMKKIYHYPINLYNGNTLSMPSQVNSEPWETNSNGNNLKQQLYNGNEVYYHINADPGSQVAQLYQVAVAGWNSLGVIKLVPTDSNDEHVIQMNSPQSFDTDQYDAITHYYYYNDDIMFNTSIDLRGAFLKYDDYYKVKVIEHEIGHALGFAHYNKLYPNKSEALMNYRADVYGTDAYNSYQGERMVGAIEQQKLMQMYGLNVMDGYYEYPSIKDQSIHSLSNKNYIYPINDCVQHNDSLSN